MAPKSWLLTAICVFLTACFSDPAIPQTKQHLSTSIPNLGGFDVETRQSMKVACVSEYTNGPVAYSACLNRQIASLQSSQGIPNLSGYDTETRQSMKVACVSEFTNGPVDYGACLNRQIASLQGAQAVPNLSGFDTEMPQTTTSQHRYAEVGGDTPAFAAAANAASPGYADKVRRRVRPNIVWSGETAGLEAEVAVRCSPSGTLLSATITHSSGNPSWDDAVLRAVQRSDPMPVDIDGKAPASLKVALRPAG